MAFEESLKKGDLDMAKLFVDHLSNNDSYMCGSSLYYISGSAKNLGRMELSDIGKVTLRNLIDATRFKDTSITEDLIISVVQSGVKINHGGNYGIYQTDATYAYKHGLMKLVRYLLKDKEVHPIDVTCGRPPNFYNHEAIEYYIQSIFNTPKEPKENYADFTLEKLINLFELTLLKYGLYEETKYDIRKKQSSRFPTPLLESLRTDQMNDYKKGISILHQLNENNQTVEITQSDIKNLVEDHFGFIPLLIRDEILWTSCLQPSKSAMIKASFEETLSKYNAEGMKFFWDYMNEIKSSSPELHKQIGTLYAFEIDDAVKYNQHEFLNVVFNYPHSPLYHKKTFAKNNKLNDAIVTYILNEFGMESIRRNAYQYGHIHIINMCNNIINYFKRDITINK